MNAIVEIAAQAEDHLTRWGALTKMSGPALERLFNGPPGDALPWIRAAAEVGVAAAQIRLGHVLLDGAGTPPDRAQAYAWFLTAARTGDGAAMNMAGRCLENGWGVPRDLTAAAVWYQRSALRGHDWGQYNYAHMLFDGLGGIVRDPQAALSWYLKAAEQGHGRAMNLVARCMEQGWGTSPNHCAAIHWFRRSAEAGYHRAQHNYASILAEQGDFAGAAMWLSKAAAQGHAPSAEALAGLRTP
jgi:TPR repeat protein